MAYKYITKYTSPARTKARRGKKEITNVTLHWWGDPAQGPTFDGTCKYLSRPSATTSSHYVVEAGKIACLVNPKDIAYGNGNWASNKRSIVIEMNPKGRDEDYETGAELIRELEKAYGRLVIDEHRDHKATACPGVYRAETMRAIVDRKAPSKSAAYYTIKAGDTLGKLAARFKTSVAKLAKLNGISNPNRINAGQRIKTK